MKFNSKKQVMLLFSLIIIFSLTSCSQSSVNTQNKVKYEPKATTNTKNTTSNDSKDSSIDLESNNTTDNDTPDNSSHVNNIQDYFGIYTLVLLTDENGNTVFDSNEIKYDMMSQDYPGMFLLPDGNVSSNSGADAYYCGTWEVSGDIIITSPNGNRNHASIENDKLVMEADIEY